MSAGVTVTEGEARAVALVRALEDRAGGRPVLDAAQCAAADRVVWTSIGPAAAGLSDADWVRRFLLPRTGRLLDDAAAADPAVRRVRDTPVLKVLALAALGLAAVSAFAVDRLSQPDRINLMALPFVGFVLWNWLAYLVLALQPAWDLPGALASRLGQAAAWVRSHWASRGAAASVGADVARDYVGHWWRWAPGLWRARLSAWLHAASLAIATGMLVSLAWAAWHGEFRVGWASTLCPAGCVHAVHATLSLPVQPLADAIGAQPFSAAEIAQRHGWQDGAPDDGMRWFRLTFALLVLTVVLPRLLLLALALASVRRRRARVRLPLDDRYFAAMRHPPADLLAAPAAPPAAAAATDLNARMRRGWARLKDALRGRRSTPGASPGG